MPTPTDADDALYVALLHVCERSFFAFVESCDPVQFAVLVAKTEGRSQDGDAQAGTAPQPSRWLKASVAFEGISSSGAIEVFLPDRLARRLVASLLGISREVDADEMELLDGQVFDGIGEFANMVCGAWLTDLAGSQAFTLGSPAVNALLAGWNPQSDLCEQEQGHRLCILDLPMRIFVRSSPE